MRFMPILRSQRAAVFVWLGNSAVGAFAGSGFPQLYNLGDLPGGQNFSIVQSISGDGSTVVGSSGSASGNQAVRWTAGSGLIGLGDLPGGLFQSESRGVSADGQVISGHGFVSSTVAHSFR